MTALAWLGLDGFLFQRRRVMAVAEHLARPVGFKGGQPRSRPRVLAIHSLKKAAFQTADEPLAIIAGNIRAACRRRCGSKEYCVSPLHDP
jgi:hypothetical protein